MCVVWNNQQLFQPNNRIGWGNVSTFLVLIACFFPIFL